MIVIGTIMMKAVKDLNPLCLRIYGTRNIWVLCSQDILQKQQFFSLITNLFLKEKKASFNDNEQNRFHESEIQNSKLPKYTPSKKLRQHEVKLVTVEDIVEDQPIWLFPTPTPVCNQDWSYKVHGADWVCKCSESFSQSPITIKRKYNKIRPISIPAIFDFPIIQAKSLSLSILPNIFKLSCDNQKVNNCDDFVLASIIDYDATEYVAYEVLFHFPNEHRIDDEVYEMELQIIYKAVSEGDSRKKAGLAFLIKETPGAKNLFLNKMNVLNIPQGINQNINLADNNKAKDLSLGDLFKFQESEIMAEKGFNYFSYIGSLTNPPCDEPLKWFVVEKPIPMGLADLETLKTSVMRSLDGPKEVLEDIEGWKDKDDLRKKDGNFRQEQALNDRWIEYYNRGNSSNTYSVSKSLLF